MCGNIEMYVKVLWEQMKVNKNREIQSQIIQFYLATQFKKIKIEEKDCALKNLTNLSIDPVMKCET